LQVAEIYTSDDDLHVELPSYLRYGGDSDGLSSSILRSLSKDTNENNKNDNTIRQTRSFLNKNYHVSTISNKTFWVRRFE
jgi:hypothetical protein